MEIVIPSVGSIGLFVVAALVLLVVPGPSVLYIVARSMAQGRTSSGAGTARSQCSGSTPNWLTRL